MPSQDLAKRMRVGSVCLAGAEEGGSEESRAEATKCQRLYVVGGTLILRRVFTRSCERTCEVCWSVAIRTFARPFEAECSAVG